MIETKEKVINGSSYAVTQLPARRALKLKTKLIKLFGPALTQLFMTAFEEKTIVKPDLQEENEERLVQQQIDDMKKANFVKGVQLLVQNLDEKTFDELVLEMIQGVRKDGKELTLGAIDMDFAGNLYHLYELLYHVLETNFADFFALGGIGNHYDYPAPMPNSDMKKTYTYK